MTRDGQGIHSARYSAGMLFFTNEKIEQKQTLPLSLSLKTKIPKKCQLA
jgi:hypothetical protein